jgi:hypothetical protein
MLGNGVEFIVRDRIAERYAEGENSRLAKQARKRKPAPRQVLGRAIYWLGSQLISWSQMLQYPGPISTVKEPEGSTP